MAHWLDGLFEGEGITIEWENLSEPLPEVTTLRFSSAFGIDYDAANKKAIIDLSSLDVELDGDAIGNADDNIIVRISGDEEESNVEMRAVTLYWHPSVSEGEAGLVISGDELAAGALEIWHDEKRAAQFAGSGPIFGNAT